MNESKKETVSILVVDDDSDTRNIVASAINMQGFQAIEAPDGETAIKICSGAMPHLIVLDIMMPGMDGNDVCRAVRQMESGELVPIIMLTARDQVKDKVKGLEAGADDYLTKPFHYQELQARINALLRVRDLNIALQEKNNELAAMQQRLVEQEKKLVVGQLAGTAAHQLGQPLSAITLNVFLLESLDPTDPKYKHAVEAIKLDAAKMAKLLEDLKTADPKEIENYYGETSILKLKK